MSNKKEQLLEQCYHCGNKGMMNVLCSHKKKYGGFYINEDGQPEKDLEESFKWIMLECPVCNQISLLEIYTNECYYDSFTNEQLFDESIIYPLNNYNLLNVPKDISNSFESSLKVKNINIDLCLIAIRKTLELICNDKHAKGNCLKTKIDYLIRINVFPKEMESAYGIIRNAGNKAAHDVLKKISKHDIDEIISLLYSIINYLYIIPKKMTILSEKLEDIN